MTVKCNSDSDQTPISFEEALDRTGNGLYNILLAMTCALILLAIGMDMFGLSLVVAAACDLDLTVTQKGILTSLPFIGILLVSFFWGYVSDTRGRRFTLVVPLMISFILSCISSLSPHWIFLGVAKFFCVCFACAANSVTYTLVGESCIQRVRNKYMLLMTCLILLSPAVAGVVTYPTLKLDFAAEIPWLGIVYRPWRLLIIVLALPTGIGAIAIYFFRESPKFLYNSGKQEEALEVLKYIHSVNHRRSKEEFPVYSLKLEEHGTKKKMSLLKAMYEQSAPLFRSPYLWRSLQLFYIVAVVYITNNSFLIWLPHILNVIRLSMESEVYESGNICHLISTKAVIAVDTNSTLDEIPSVGVGTMLQIGVIFQGPNQKKGHLPDDKHPMLSQVCVSTVERNVIITLVASQSVFAFLNFIISCLPNRRRLVLITILCISAVSGVCLNLVPEPISSVFFFMAFTCTCLGMGILASYFVDIYPTSYRGMVACLSIMVGRSCTFIGINIVGNLIFNHCQVTFYMWSLLVLSSAIAAWFLPPDKPPAEVVPKAMSA